MKRTVVFAAAAIGSFAQLGHAQSARTTDARFSPFVGCWRIDSASTSSRDALKCVVPVAASGDVELIDLVDGKVSDRRRVDAGGRPRAIDEEGCRGQEQASWSEAAHRLYLHAAFVCAPNGIAGNKTTLMSILPSGEWLQVESVRSGVGSLTHVERRRDAGLPSSVPHDIAERIGTRRLAMMTARADAASPLRSSDVVEALHHTDSSVVRAWLVATAQPFQLSGDEVASLVRADVPSPVLQAMMSTAPSYQLGRVVDATGRSSSDAYLSTPGISGNGAGQGDVTVAGQQPQQSVYIYDACCVTSPGYQQAYQAHDYYAPAPVVTTYYPGSYAPYYFSYRSGHPARGYQNGYARSYGPAARQSAPTPSYYSNPVGVRAGQRGASPIANAPSGVPSRRRP